MPDNFKVGVLVGSLRKESFNLKLAKALTNLSPENLAFDFVEIGDLPLYNEDLEHTDVPESWRRFRRVVKDVDAVLFVTPEYNRSVPAALKNAIDVGSRPMGKSVWDRKPAAIATGSPGTIGGFGANHILRQSLVSLNMPALQQPEVYLGGIGGMFDSDGNVTKLDTRTFLSKFMVQFAAWIALHVDP